MPGAWLNQAVSEELELVEREAEWIATESGPLMTRMQAQEFWHRMVSETWGSEGLARITGDPEVVRPLMLDLSLLVFADDAPRSRREWRRFWNGVAVALLIDATIVRSVLVPATMKLLGERNWYLPPGLSWLPDVHVEGSEPPRAGQPGAWSTHAKEGL